MDNVPNKAALRAAGLIFFNGLIFINTDYGEVEK